MFRLSADEWEILNSGLATDSIVEIEESVDLIDHVRPRPRAGQGRSMDPAVRREDAGGSNMNGSSSSGGSALGVRYSGESSYYGTSDASNAAKNSLELVGGGKYGAAVFDSIRDFWGEFWR